MTLAELIWHLQELRADEELALLACYLPASVVGLEVHDDGAVRVIEHPDRRVDRAVLGSCAPPVVVADLADALVRCLRTHAQQLPNHVRWRLRRWVVRAAGFLTTNDPVTPTAAVVLDTVNAVVRTYRHWHLQQVLWPAAVYLRQHPQIARRVFAVRLLPGGRLGFELLGGLPPAVVTPAFDGLDLKLAWRLGVQGAGYGCVGDAVLLFRGDFRHMRQGVYGLCRALLQQTPLVLRCMGYWEALRLLDALQEV